MCHFIPEKDVAYLYRSIKFKLHFLCWGWLYPHWHLLTLIPFLGSLENKTKLTDPNQCGPHNTAFHIWGAALTSCAPWRLSLTRPLPFFTQILFYEVVRGNVNNNMHFHLHFHSPSCKSQTSSGEWFYKLWM